MLVEQFNELHSAESLPKTCLWPYWSPLQNISFFMGRPNSLTKASWEERGLEELIVGDRTGLKFQRCLYKHK